MKKNKFRKIIGVAIRQYRKLQGINLGDLFNYQTDKSVSVTESNLSRIENGKTNTTLDTVEAIFDKLGYEIVDIVLRKKNSNDSNGEVKSDNFERLLMEGKELANKEILNTTESKKLKEIRKVFASLDPNNPFYKKGIELFKT